ncbi:hypothetical protein L0222_28910 [bacterium]|nr:hypothetical protein [bacterium]
MKRFVVLLCFLFSCSSLSYAQDTSVLELKSIERLIASTEKLTRNKSIKAPLKKVRKQMNQVRDLWQAGAVTNSLGLLLQIRSTLYKYGASESQTFQQNLRSAMKRLWPFLLKSGRFRSDTHTSQGITLVRLIVPEGTFVMSFPASAKPGETVSGRIQATPASSASLYLLTAVGSPVVPDGALQKWNLPQQFELILNDPWGNEIVRAKHQIQVPANVLVETGDGVSSELQREKQPREAQPNIEIPYLRFQISSRAKAGGPIVVEGPFDGDFSTTRVGLGQYQGYVLAESPGRLILATHSKMTGDWTILIIENDIWVRCRVKLQTEEVDPFATLATCTPP